jgi:hypothetical protein
MLKAVLFSNRAAFQLNFNGESARFSAYFTVKQGHKSKLVCSLADRGKRMPAA